MIGDLVCYAEKISSVEQTLKEIALLGDTEHTKMKPLLALDVAHENWMNQ